MIYSRSRRRRGHGKVTVDGGSSIVTDGLDIVDINSNTGTGVEQNIVTGIASSNGIMGSRDAVGLIDIAVDILFDCGTLGAMSSTR